MYKIKNNAESFGIDRRLMFPKWAAAIAAGSPIYNTAEVIERSQDAVVIRRYCRWRLHHDCPQLVEEINTRLSDKVGDELVSYLRAQDVAGPGGVFATSVFRSLCESRPSQPS